MATSVERDIEALRNEFSDLKSDVANLADTIKKLYGDTAVEGRERARQAAERARNRARETAGAIEEEIGSRPMTSIATAFSVGFIVGKLLDR